MDHQPSQISEKHSSDEELKDVSEKFIDELPQLQDDDVLVENRKEKTKVDPNNLQPNLKRKKKTIKPVNPEHQPKQEPKEHQPKREYKERKISEIEEIKFLPVGCGRSLIGIWHRPTPKHIANLKTAGITMIVSLQGTREHIEDVQSSCRLHDISWLNIPLDGANLPLLRNIVTKKMVHQKLQELLAIIQGSDQKILLHCAAGIHRTGTITYSVLRLLGNSKEDAMIFLKQLREITFEQVGQHRVDLAEEFFVQPLLTSIKQVENHGTKDVSHRQEDAEEQKVNEGKNNR